MSQHAAVWVHGLTAQAESPVMTGMPRGWGKEFVGRWTSRWFHIALTPLVSLEHVRPKLAKVFGFDIPLTDGRPRLTRVFVFYETHGAFIDALHIYDGRNIVQAFEDDRAVEGDHTGNSDASNTWVIDPPREISFGLGISVLVTNRSYKEPVAQGEEATQGDEGPQEDEGVQGDEDTQEEEDTEPNETGFAKKAKVTLPPASVFFTSAGAEFEIPEADDIKSGPGTNTLLPNEKLRLLDSLISTNGRYRLEFQGDGNLVLKNAADDSPAGFATGTVHLPSYFAPYCEMQADGNFVVHYSPLGAWDTETWDHPGAFLRVQDDGKVVIIDPGARIWRRP